MAWKYNPFTDALDLTGSGGASYIDGVVADSSLLPVTLGTPALDSVFLAKAGSGLWLISRRPAGLYVRVANNGVAADWTYLGAFPEVNSSANWSLYDGTTPSKELKFDLSAISNSTVRTLTAPNASGRIQLEGQAIGDTTPAAGTFTTLAANNGTLTASAPVLDLAQTWNASGTTFTGLNLALTNTASASASSYFNINLDGGEVFSIRRGESSVNATLIRCGGSGLRWTGRTRTGGGVGLNFGDTLGIGTSLEFLATASGTAAGDVALLRDGASDTLAQRRSTNAQTFNIYNTFTSTTNHERGFLKWSSNVFQIGTEKGSGGGTARDLELQSDGITRMRISGTPRVFGGLINYAGSITGAATIGIGTFGYLSGTAGNSGGLSFYNGNGGSVGARLGTEEDFVLAMRNAGNSHSLRIYNTHTSTTSWERLNLRWASNEFILDAEAGSGGGTLRGLKIGSATSSLLGFYGVTPVDQPATVTDPAGGGTVDTEARTAVNAIIDRLQELGLIA
jgi:hypothetical protein